MKNVFLPTVVLLALLFSSCSRYQINTLSSTNTVKDKNTGVFYFENDSVKISYSFYGPNAPVAIQVYNKMEKPIYVDWQRSALIIGDKAISYAPSKIDVSGAINTRTDNYNFGARGLLLSNPSYSSGSISAVANLPKELTFLPPHTQSSNTTLTLTQGFINIADSLMNKEHLQFQDNYVTKQTNIKVARFDKNNSPLTFKSYLTLYMVNGKDAQPVAYSQEFFVSQSYNTLDNPKNLEPFKQQRGDYFINKKATGYQKAMAGIGVAAVAGATVVAYSNSGNNLGN